MQGALCTIFSTTLAASIAFSFAQGLGRSFAQKMIDSEVGGEPGKGDNAAQRVRSLRQHPCSAHTDGPAFLGSGPTGLAHAPPCVPAVEQQMCTV